MFRAHHIVFGVIAIFLALALSFNTYSYDLPVPNLPAAPHVLPSPSEDAVILGEMIDEDWPQN